MIDKLNEAAKQNADELWRLCDWQPNWDDLYESFIAGAEWQKGQVLSLIESRISQIMGDAQPRPALRAELRDLIDLIKG